MNALTPGWSIFRLAAPKTHRKIAMTTVAASGFTTISLQKSQGFFASPAVKKNIASRKRFWGVASKLIAGSLQRPWPQVVAAARFRGRSDHGTLRSFGTTKSLCTPKDTQDESFGDIPRNEKHLGPRFAPSEACFQGAPLHDRFSERFLSLSLPLSSLVTPCFAGPQVLVVGV